MSLTVDDSNSNVVVTGSATDRSIIGAKYFKVIASNVNVGQTPSNVLTITFTDPCLQEVFSISPSTVNAMSTTVLASVVTQDITASTTNNLAACGSYSYDLVYAAADTNAPQPTIDDFITVTSAGQLRLLTTDSSHAGKTFTLNLVV